MKECKASEVSDRTEMPLPRKLPPGNQFRTSKLKDCCKTRNNQNQSFRLTKECKPTEGMNNDKTQILQRAQTPHSRTTKIRRTSRRKQIPESEILSHIRQGETCDNPFQTSNVRDLRNAENKIDQSSQLTQEYKLTAVMNILRRRIDQELKYGKGIRKPNSQDVRNQRNSIPQWLQLTKEYKLS
jgi:hypothetical protein